MFDDLLDDLEELHEGGDGAVVGIDLGTTNSVVACVENGEARVLVDAQGINLHPSVIAWLPSGERKVGLEARLRRVIDPENTVFSAKRIIGQQFSAPKVKEALANLPYRVVEGDNQDARIVTREGDLPVPQISAYVLAHLKAVAEAELGRPVTHCVVTVPAHFSDAQRAATRQAAALTGMDVLRVLNEPTAAALAYGKSRKLHERIAIFDLGGGTFDVSVLAVRANLYEVLATGGDPFLGGDDIDRLIADRLARQFLEEHRIDPMTDPVARARLLVAAEQVKMRLSVDEQIEADISEIARGRGGKPLGLAIRMTRGELEALIAPLVDRTLEVTRRVLSEAGGAPGSIDEIILVGGSTRVPCIQQRVAEIFGKVPKVEINPMEVVALGAAIQGQHLFSPGQDQHVLMDVTPHSLRIATAGGYSKVLVEKNATVPAEGVGTFHIARDGQTTVQVRVAQGEEDRFDDNRPLGELLLEGLPEGKRSEIGVRVAFTIDADGILQVSAKETSSGRAAHATLSLIGVDEQR